jgi:phosphoribosylanthranilate isomerase
MWIKICGNTNLHDAHLAIEAGADALGFVLAASPRQVDSETVRKILSELPPAVETYGVFASASFDEIRTVLDNCALTGVQIHRGIERDLASRLRAHFFAAGREIAILPVVSISVDGEAAGPATARSHSEPAAASAREAFTHALTEAASEPGVRAVLLDSSTKKAAGGTGLRFDWAEARQSLRSRRTRLRIVVAGGLRPENVGEAIRELRPWGVDVVSGVEASPGRKDPARLREFIRAAREAGSAIPQPE